MKQPKNDGYSFAIECIERLHSCYKKYHLLYDRECDSHAATSRELREFTSDHNRKVFGFTHLTSMELRNTRK